MNRCSWCGALHPGSKCPLIKAVVYGENGEITRLEFFGPTEVPQGYVYARPADVPPTKFVAPFQVKI